MIKKWLEKRRAKAEHMAELEGIKRRYILNAFADTGIVGVYEGFPAGHKMFLKPYVSDMKEAELSRSALLRADRVNK